MHEKSDAQLLHDYARRGDESAFAELIRRHTNLVYSAAARQVDSPDLAAEVAQSVFIGLARGAESLIPRLSPDASLAGWLCRSARNVSLNLRRDESRRHSRERQAMQQLDSIPESAPDWEQLRPVLDEAMSELDETDYDALVLRFFKNQDLRSVGLAQGVSDDTAQKRVSRALDKLRDYLSRRGIRTTTTALSVVLTANAVQAAPVGLALSISSAAAIAGTTITTAATATATKAIAMTALQKTLLTTAVVATVGTGIFQAQRNSALREQITALQQMQTSLTEQLQNLNRDQAAANQTIAVLQEENERLKNNTHDLLRLRSELAQQRTSDNTQTHTLLAEMRSWLERLHQLKAKLDQMPDQTIPELQFVDEATWLDVTRDRLNTDEEFRRAFSRLRNSGESKFAGMLKLALRAYGEANEGLIPTAVAQLKPFFPTPVDDALLQRFEVLPAENVKLKRPVALPALPNGYFIVQRHRVDEELDQRWIIYNNGIAAVTRDVEIIIGPFESHSR